MDREEKAAKVVSEMGQEEQKLEEIIEKMEKENRYLKAIIENLELRMRRDEVKEQFDEWSDEIDTGGD